ncbi:MAG TPA: DUF192 domain-containing protein [Candidatus Paceibacterota bacterium]
MAFIQNNRFFILLGIALLSLGVLFLLLGQGTRTIVPGFTDGTLVSGSTRIAVSIADSESERVQGLSNTDPLPKGVGKFFIFDTPEMHGFWMKDMRYAIDIIWLDAQMRVVSIKTGAAPESYPETFYPSAESLYVLEVPSGFSTAKSIEVGQTFTLLK